MSTTPDPSSGSWNGRSGSLRRSRSAGSGSLRRSRSDRPEAAPARLTRRGRTVLVLTFLAIALGLMIPFGGWATATLTGGTPEPVRVVEVQPGQTLYDVAGQVAKPGHIREMVYRIEELNSLPSATISEGQKLAIPKG